MRRFAEGEYFHVFNRGVEKRLIFSDNQDRWRFLTLLIAFQGDTSFNQLGKLVYYVEHRMFDNEDFKKILKNRKLELISFCLMPNHFHLILKETTEGGISKFMQRLLNSYTKYFNIKHNRTGHLFGGKFKSVHIESNEYLNYLSAYIHLNSRDLREWRGREINYPWSSFQDYVKENRFQNFLNSDIMLEQFSNQKEYQSFVEETPIKQLREELGEDSCLD